MLPTLETARLRLRAPQWSDLEAIYALGSSPQVMRYITPGRVQTREEARADLERRIAFSREEGPYGYWVMERRSDGAFVGWAALKPLDNTEEIEVGYRLLETYWGQGLATEAAACLLDYGFEELALPRIVAVTMPENEPSRRVMTKLGMRMEGVRVCYYTRCAYYVLQREDWQKLGREQEGL